MVWVGCYVARQGYIGTSFARFVGEYTIRLSQIQGNPVKQGGYYSLNSRLRPVSKHGYAGLR